MSNKRRKERVSKLRVGGEYGWHSRNLLPGPACHEISSGRLTRPGLQSVIYFLKHEGTVAKKISYDKSNRQSSDEGFLIAVNWGRAKSPDKYLTSGWNRFGIVQAPVIYF